PRRTRSAGPPVASPNRTRVGADQEWQALDRRVATDVEENTATGPEGSELLVTLGDAPRPTALIPAARGCSTSQRRQNASRSASASGRRVKRPSSTPLGRPRSFARSRPSRTAASASAPGHDQEGTAPRPGSQSLAPSLRLAAARPSSPPRPAQPRGP